MIKNIINWTCSGFFRTLGKLILFVVIGLIVGIFLSQKKINLPLISFGKVYAETGVYNTSTYAYYYTECNLLGKYCELTSPSTFTSMGTVSNPGTLPRLVGSPATSQYMAIGGIAFRVYLSSSQTAYNANYTYQFKWRVCESTKWTGNDTLGKLQQMSKIMRVDYNTSNSATNAIEGDTSLVGLSLTDDPSSNYCWYANFTYSPPVNVKYIGFYMSTNSFTSLTDNSGNYSLGYNGIITGNDFRTNGLTVSYTTDATSQAINQQTTIINNSINNVLDQVNDLNDLLNDTDTNTYTNEFYTWLSEFNLGIDGPVSQIILLPVSMLSSFLDPTSTANLCFTLKGKQVCFPNGSIFWGRTGCTTEGSWFGCPNLTAFREFVVLIGGGFIIWRLLVKMVHTIHKCLDPQDLSETILIEDSADTWTPYKGKHAYYPGKRHWPGGGF